MPGNKSATGKVKTGFRGEHLLETLSAFVYDLRSGVSTLKKYHCFPQGNVATLVLLAENIFIVCGIYFGFVPSRVSFTTEDIFVFIGLNLLALGGFACAGMMWTRGARYVLVEPSRLICKCPFRKDIVMEYERCIVGMDYSEGISMTVWWIYLTYEPLPKYNPKIPANRINALKYKDGFVRIAYSDEVYEALLAVLPKKQKNALVSAYRMHIEND